MKDRVRKKWLNVCGRWSTRYAIACCVTGQRNAGLAKRARRKLERAYATGVRLDRK